jgi:hypothetical protein
MEKELPMGNVVPGTVLGVSRGLYAHYGVLSANGKVIHYTTSGSSDISGDIRIRKTSVGHFLRGRSSFWTMSFPSKDEACRILKRRYEMLAELLLRSFGPIVTTIVRCAGKDLASSAVLRDYSPKSSSETLGRAKSRIGERRYNIATRNCEHFAFWCATGLATSLQVEAFLCGGASLISLLLGSRSQSSGSCDSMLSRNASDLHSLFRRSRSIPAEAILANDSRMARRSLFGVDMNSWLRFDSRELLNWNPVLQAAAQGEKRGL